MGREQKGRAIAPIFLRANLLWEAYKFMVSGTPMGLITGAPDWTGHLPAVNNFYGNFIIYEV